MQIVGTEIEGVKVIEMAPHYDERGYFSRTWDRAICGQNGLSNQIAQINHSYSELLGTLRGLHWQALPGDETKMVHCLKGRVFDVVVDLRPQSKTRGKWLSFDLAARDFRALFIPRQCAHGFMTLEDHTELLYCMSSPYLPELSRGLRWNDATLGIPWPIAPRSISQRDYHCTTSLEEVLNATNDASAGR